MTWASAAAYCPIDNNMKQWTWSDPCKNPPSYQFLFGQDITVSTNESLSYYIAVNEQQQRVVISFNGTFTTDQLLLEILQFDDMSYSWQNISNAMIDEYFGTQYDNYLRSTLTNETMTLVNQ